MRLQLHDVAPAQGAMWVRQAFRLWARRPLAFVGLFSFYLLTVLLLSVLLPPVGAILGLALLPMLSLGFMIATRSALSGGPVHPLQLIEGLRTGDPARRRAQWILCGAYALGSMLVIGLADWVDEGLFEQLQRLMASPDAADETELAMVMADPRLSQGMLVRVGLAAALSVPFWHASALVHWGAQSAQQALFSSTVALWRTRGAFLVYMLAWTLVSLGVGLALVLIARLLGTGQLVSLLAMPLALAVSAAFYNSLWFSFRDSFWPDADAKTPAGAADPA